MGRRTVRLVVGKDPERIDAVLYLEAARDRHVVRPLDVKGVLVFGPPRARVPGAVHLDLRADVATFGRWNLAVVRGRRGARHARGGDARVVARARLRRSAGVHST